MSRTIVCSLGTSIAGLGNRFTEAEGDAPYRQRIRDRLNREKSENPNDFSTRISAETNSLARMKVEQGDDIVLLRTETQDGQICAEEIKTVIEKEFIAKVFIEKIDGLQVCDATAFSRTGVQNLFTALNKHCISEGSDWAKQGVFLNMTGGFKSVAAYLVLYGMLYQVPVVYLYEKSNQLLTLPPAPLQFDWERMQPAASAFMKLLEASVISRNEFFSLIQGASHDDRQWYETLLEEDGENVTLSAFGLLVARRLQRDAGATATNVLLSPSARKALDKNSSSRDLHDMLARAGNPLSRRSGQHAESHTKTDLKIWKVYTHSGPRMAYWVENNTVYVGELFSTHDEYDSFYGPNGSQYRKCDYDMGKFSSWQPPNREDPEGGQGSVGGGAQAELQSLQKERQELMKKNGDLRTEVEELRDKNRHLQGRGSRGRKAPSAKRNDTVMGAAIKEAMQQVQQGAAARGGVEGQLQDQGVSPDDSGRDL